MSSVSIQSVSRTFEGRKGQRTQALLPVDFEVRDNDFVTILGPSGCGKSTLLQIANLASEIRQRGHDYRCDVLAVERVSASLEVAAALDLRTGESVFHSLCIHREDGLPVQLEDRYVNPRQVPQFAAQDFTLLQPSEYLVRNVPFDQVEHVVDAVMPSAEQAALLEMPATEPCLLLTRRTWSRGIPITVVRCLHPASRYRLGSRFRADGNPAAG